MPIWACTHPSTPRSRLLLGDSFIGWRWASGLMRIKPRPNETSRCRAARSRAAGRRATRDPRAQVPGPQPIGDPPPRMTGLHVFASKWHENRAAKLAADQPVPDISVEEALANLPPETRERFEQVARKGGK